MKNSISKYLLFLAGSFFLFANADNASPTAPCDGVPMQECNSFMTDVFEKFQQGQDLETLETPSVYSGECRYHSPDYNGEHAHYAGLYFERKQIEEGPVTFFNGAFSFFANPNPYSDWNLEEAQNTYPMPYKFPMSPNGQASMADYMPEGGIWRFWVSQHEDGHLYLVSYWGFGTRGFCKFQRVD